MPETVLHVTDAHLRADGAPVYDRDPEQRLRLVLAACAREVGPLALLALTGDQSDDGKLASMQRARELALALAAPRLLAIRGNHDDAEAHELAFGRLTPIELSSWRVIGIESPLSGEIHGSVDVDALESLLDARDPRPTLIAIHHPPVPPTNHPWFRLEHAERMLSSLAARPHVRAVISGHVHSPFELQREDLTLLGAPSTLAPFLFDGDQLTVGAGGPTGARVLRLHEDGSIDTFLVDA